MDATYLLCKDGILYFEQKVASVRFKLRLNANTEKMCAPLWRGCGICVMGAELDYVENDIYNLISTDETQIVLDTDYLVNVTDLTKIFSSNNKNVIVAPYLPVLSAFLEHSSSYAILKGNIINACLDELIEDCEVELADVIGRTLQKNPLDTLKQIKHKSEYNNDAYYCYEALKEDIFIECVGDFERLKEIVLHNFQSDEKNSVYTEPNFISNIYGIKGRLDVMKRIQEASNKVRLEVVELKSSNKVSNGYELEFGIAEKRRIFIPLWLEHYIQIICYNMLLRSAFLSKKDVEIGVAAILYSSKSAQGSPLRSVSDNIFVQNEIIIARNWLIRYLYELSIGNIDVLRTLSTEQLNMLPTYLVDEIKLLISRLQDLPELEEAYFAGFTAYITKKIFLEKRNFATLWNQTREEKALNGAAITGLYVVREECDFENMHIVFEQQGEGVNIGNIEFRRGDICTIYTGNLVSECGVVSGQILAGRIKSIALDSNRIMVSFRNKLEQKLFDVDLEWTLENDYMDKNNNESYQGLSNLLLQDATNKELILGLQEPQFEELSDEIKDAVAELDLREEQKQIIERSISARDYFLIQGPPGTGKTSRILRNIVETLYKHTGQNILLLAFTNRAVDEICKYLEKIKYNREDGDFDFIRFGQDESTDYEQYLLKNIDISTLQVRFGCCRVFVSTVASAYSHPLLFKLKEIDTIILDEATQVAESDIIGLLTKAKRFIMIGDEKQLPAVSIVSEEEQNTTNPILSSIELYNFNDSLFERLLRVNKKNDWSAYAMLTEQSRMSLNIMSLSNNLFYNEQLQESDGIHNREDLHGEVLFYDVPASDEDKVNYAEVAQIREILSVLDDKTEVGIISPWRKQGNAIRKMLREIGMDDIIVDTVERFQGSERKTIIFSTATNFNMLNSLSVIRTIDDLAVDRKLNVAITRAKERFIMLGDRQVLEQNEIYSRLLKLICDCSNLSRIFSK